MQVVIDIETKESDIKTDKQFYTMTIKLFGIGWMHSFHIKEPYSIAYEEWKMLTTGNANLVFREGKFTSYIDLLQTGDRPQVVFVSDHSGIDGSIQEFGCDAEVILPDLDQVIENLRHAGML